MRDLILLAVINADDVKIPRISADNARLDAIFNLVYVVIAAVAVFFIVRAALLFVTSGSEPSQVKDARETILYACVGLALSSVVFVILKFVIGAL